jgi:integrase
MSSEQKIVPVGAPQALGGLLGITRGNLEEDLEAAVPENTRRAYADDWKRWGAWCATVGVDPYGATESMVYAFVRFLADEGLAATTIQRRLNGIRFQYGMADLEFPVMNMRGRKAIQGVLRRARRRPRQKVPLLPEDIEAGFRQMGDDNRDSRDRALVAFGFAGALRRSEIVAVDVEHFEWVEGGIRLLIPQSKTDVEGFGEHVAIPYGTKDELCPVRLVNEWLGRLGSDQGPVFRRMSPKGDNVLEPRAAPATVVRVVRRVAELAGHDPLVYGGHSLRAGLATAAAREGKSLKAIMDQARWTSVKTALKYIRYATQFEDNAAEGLL